MNTWKKRIKSNPTVWLLPALTVLTLSVFISTDFAKYGQVAWSEIGLVAVVMGGLSILGFFSLPK